MLQSSSHRHQCPSLGSGLSAHSWLGQMCCFTASFVWAYTSALPTLVWAFRLHIEAIAIWEVRNWGLHIQDIPQVATVYNQCFALPVALFPYPNTTLMPQQHTGQPASFRSVARGWCFCLHIASLVMLCMQCRLWVNMHDQFKTAWGADFRTLGPVASIRLEKIPGVPAGAVGCRIQDPGTHHCRWWKKADFSHSPGTAHGAPPKACIFAPMEP